MQSKFYYECLPFLIIGIYMITMGALSKTLISESDMPATEEEKAQKPTSMRRILVILGGVGCITYSLLCMRH